LQLLHRTIIYMWCGFTPVYALLGRFLPRLKAASGRPPFLAMTVRVHPTATAVHHCSFCDLARRSAFLACARAVAYCGGLALRIRRGCKYPRDNPRAGIQARRTRKAGADVSALFTNPAAYDAWASRWRSRLAAESLAPDARARAMRGSTRPSFRAIIVWSTHLMLRSSMEIFHRSPSC
jgi:hypothetical protein